MGGSMESVSKGEADRGCSTLNCSVTLSYLSGYCPDTHLGVMPEDGSTLFVSLGLFIIDEFEFRDENGEPTGKLQESEARRPLIHSYN